MADDFRPFQKYGKTWVARELSAHDLSVDPRGNLMSLARKYDTSPQEIVSANEVQWSTKAINEWVMDAGGKMLSSGFAVFQPGNKLFLPSVAAIPEPSKGGQALAPQAAQVKVLGLPWWAWAAAGGVGALALMKSRKKGNKQ